MNAIRHLPNPGRSLALAVLLTAAACGGGGGTTPPPAATLSSIALTPASLSLAAGATQQMVAVGSYSDGSSKDVTADVAWTSNATAVATVSAGGLVSAAGGATAGQVASITASLSGKTQVAVLTITGGGGVTLTSVTVAPAAPSLAPGGTQQLTATANYSNGSNTNVTATATWTTSSAAVATVSTAGLVTAAGGATNGQTATITATFQGQAGTSVVTISTGGGGSGITLTPAGGSVRIGRTLQLAAALTTGGTDVTRTATWSSSATAVCTVSNTGLVTPAGGATAGQTATITATSGASTGQATVTVAAAAAAIGVGASNDPLIPQQWFLDNTGQTAFADTAGVAGFDVNPGPAHALGIAGLGVKVAVIDSGMEIAHEDLAANVVTGSINFANGSGDPTTTETHGDHGTMVTGLIGAVQGNAKGGMGVAPRVGLNGYNLLGPGVTGSNAELVAALGQSASAPQSSDVWVFNQSFGLSNATPADQPTDVADAYAAGTSLRGGRGAVYVKSSGNGFLGFGQATCTAANAIGITCQNASMDPANTVPYNIVVGALNASGVKSSYSTAGSALWVSAPGGEYGLNASWFQNPGSVPATAFMAAMVTTDDSGCAKGAAQNPAPASWGTPSDFNFNQGGTVNVGCNYTNTMNGTSSAAPVTSGVVALMLEANPSLTWRDVKHILATTAVKVDAANPGVTFTNQGSGRTFSQAEQPWITNAAGRSFHNWYGFGLIDAGAAVTAARSYAYGSLGTFTDSGWVTSNANLAIAIPDEQPTGATHGLSVPAAIVVEAVQVNVMVTHTYWGDLAFELTSPSGTRSVMFNAKNGFDALNGQGVLHLSSNAFYGESANGTWTLKLVDTGPADTGTIDQWQIKVSGH